MSKAAAAAVAALVLAALAGSARAGDTWAVVPTTPQLIMQASSTLPSADTPSLSGTLPSGWTSPPAVAQQVSYPELMSIWQRAGAAYAIPWEVLASINKIESNFGRNMGPSSAGAVGWMQFMPDTWLRWGTDGNGDGIADPWNAEDGIYSAARYLAASGGGQDIRRAIFSYNHADWYVNEVMQLAQLFGSAGADATFTLDRMQVSLDAAQTNVAAASEALVGAQQEHRALARRSGVLERRADRAKLLTSRIALQRLATLASIAANDASSRVESAKQDLASATAELGRARFASRAASFSPAASTLLDGATYSGGYVFPVGGGPSVVSVSHTHHDYPAADIAAPMGSPVYALADAVVESAWTVPDPRCGIGVTMRTADGLTWTYCHLSYLYPSIQAGVTLTAGAPVGLVGSTGESTGPHLHIQTHPATLWPQQLAWFQGFAGTGFRWQDAPTPEAAPRVFALVDGSGPVIGFTP